MLGHVSLYLYRLGHDLERVALCSVSLCLFSSEHLFVVTHSSSVFAEKEIYIFGKKFSQLSLGIFFTHSFLFFSQPHFIRHDFKNHFDILGIFSKDFAMINNNSKNAGLLVPFDHNRFLSKC